MNQSCQKFNTVGLIGRYGDSSISATLHDLNEYLAKRDIQVLLDESTSELVSDLKLPVGNRMTLGEKCDLIIVIGGDGTLLNAARSLADSDIPILGINLGRLGFLADLSPNEMEMRLDEILQGKYRSENRFLLHTRIEREGEIISESDAFNDVVVHKWDVARMVEISTFVDNHYVNTMHSDGLIVSTPTGSTAYALSGGGPILIPTLNAIVLVPICPHTMSNRPVVIHGDSTIKIEVTENSRSHAQVTCDGQINLGLVSGDRILIEKKHTLVHLIHPLDYNYYEILRAKFKWSEGI